MIDKVKTTTAKQPTYNADDVRISYLDGRAETIGLDSVNAALSEVGVRITRVDIPPEAQPLLARSRYEALEIEDHNELISLFPLNRGELLDEIRLAGRQPEMHRGGFMNTTLLGGTPYPKVVDVKKIPSAELPVFQSKMSKLHSNSSEDGVGIDEVTTILSGGESLWFFRLLDNTVVKVTIGPVDHQDKAWRISYPGLGIHGTYLDSGCGILIAYAHGPNFFQVRYSDPSIQGAEMLGTNPWIDYSGETPILIK
ncbi:hypothetical protein ACN1C3_16855 [Pseudomonas sp. H11T01]|uniref:hypothetical protein n=1 Tax=Pseudomonas sp. H11T01 TaxID=3402749 RepID=UPI003ACCB70D